MAMVTISPIIQYLKDNFILFMKNLIVAIIIILIGFIIAKTVDKSLYRFLREIELNKIIKKLGWKFNIEKFISKLLYYIIILITIIMGLSQLDLATTALNILLAGLVIFVIFLLVIWIKDFIPNLFAGFLIKKAKKFRKGEKIIVKQMNIEGRIKKIGLNEIQILNKNKDHIYLPYSALYRYDVVVKKK